MKKNLKFIMKYANIMRIKNIIILKQKMKMKVILIGKIIFL